MILLLSAITIGFIHSLSPAHWLPIVLLGKGRRWKPEGVAAASLVTGFSHIVVTSAIALLAVFLGEKILGTDLERFETYSGYGLIFFGVIYGGLAYWNHYRCHGHGHHGPDPKSEKSKRPIGFLIAVGLAPCVAILPLLIAAGLKGWASFTTSALAFSLGVFAALGFSTYAVSRGALKLDHPFLEHYGDVVTGVGVALTGLFVASI
ncbi:MAG: hypothetical protein JNL01_01370 [Bdellovibrionales bacterium]|nr:hypothetical protein [Bdellovibrionales bacterium]